MSVLRGEHAHPAWLAVTSLGSIAAAIGAIAIAGAWVSPRPVAEPAPAPARAAVSDARPPSDASPASDLSSVPAIRPAPERPATPAAPPAPPPDRDAPPAPDGCAAVALRFAYGAIRPPPDAGAALEPVIAYLRAHPGAGAVVDGHADPTGDDAGNLVLSRRRADRVAELLIAAGVARARVVERAFGAYVPIVGEPGGPGGTLRRVRVSIHDPSCAQEDRP